MPISKVKREDKKVTIDVFKKRFNDLYLRSGLNRKEIADVLLVGESTIRQWIEGNVLPDAAALVRIARFFNCSVDYLTLPEATDQKSTATSRSIAEYTGLNEKALNVLKDLKKHMMESDVDIQKDIARIYAVLDLCILDVALAYDSLEIEKRRFQNELPLLIHLASIYEAKLELETAINEQSEYVELEGEFLDDESSDYEKVIFRTEEKEEKFFTLVDATKKASDNLDLNEYRLTKAIGNIDIYKYSELDDCKDIAEIVIRRKAKS